MAITVHIEELVLHGFDPRDRHAFGDALRMELAELFRTEHGTAGGADASPRVTRATIDGVRSPAAPRAIAGAIHREVVR